jgi:PIN domain nuclease of toxin-antitoxin system
MIVADTHAWIWWTARSSRLSKPARDALGEASEIGVCAISVWEVAMLVGHGRLTLDRPVLTWVRQALALPRVTLLELTPERAVAAADTSAVSDPADRMIVATARSIRASIVTKDRAIRALSDVRTIW